MKMRQATASPNSGHTATVLRTFAQIRQIRTLYASKTLFEIRVVGGGVRGWLFKIKSKIRQEMSIQS
jgi:hypothetical protein